MDEREPTTPPTAACAEDLERIRELTARIERERAERVRLQEGCDESRKLVHALNNALSIITTFAAVLRDDVEPESPVRESVDEIASAARTAASLSRRLGEIQRRAAREEEPDQGRA